MEKISDTIDLYLELLKNMQIDPMFLNIGLSPAKENRSYVLVTFHQFL